LCCSIALMAGCSSSSSLVNVWSDTAYQPPPMKKILVIGVWKNPFRRKLWEDAFTAEFAKHHVEAVSSYLLFPDSAPDTEQAIRSVRENAFDGVLIVRRQLSDSTMKFTSSYTTTEQGVRYVAANDGFITYYRDVYHPSYVDTETVDVRSIDVWETKDKGRLVWSGTSNTSDASATEIVPHGLIKLVLKELTHSGMIASSR